MAAHEQSTAASEAGGHRATEALPTPAARHASAALPPFLLAAHPSAPIPVQGPPVGASVRVPLGESGLSVFPVVLGGAEFGWNVDVESSYAILDAYLERGGNIVHTSDSFAAGRSEYIIGEWVQSRGVRDEVLLATRVGNHPDHPGLDAVNLVRAVEASLMRLRTDHIDVLYLDGTTGASPLEETLSTAEWLVESGKVRSVGAFGFRPEHLVEARILASAGYPRLTVLDVPYNMLHRDEFTRDLRLVVSAQGLALTPSHALEHGFLSGRHRRRSDVGRSVRGVQLAASMNRRGTRVLRTLDRIGSELAAVPAAVAIAWLLAQRIVAAPIVNAFAPSHVQEFIQGVGVRLNRTQLAEISRAVQ